MSKSVANGRGNAAFFCTSNTERASSQKTPQRRVRTTTLLDGVVDGERVLVYEPKQAPLEKEIEIQIRVALAAAGVFVKKHNIDRRATFGTGLGIGTPDLFCIVPPMGRVLFIEVKRPGRKPTLEQRQFIAAVRRKGAVAGVATSVAEAMELVEEARRV